MATLELIRTYLDDLLVISKDSLDDHLEKLKMVLIRLREAWLKINAEKSTFCALETEYMGYTLTREGIAPQTKKGQAILAINLQQMLSDYDNSLAWYNITKMYG